jgi:chaperone modulatory protein CbpM
MTTMAPAESRPPHGTVVEVEFQLTLVELCRAAGAREEQVSAWVHEGALLPEGSDPRDWCFAASSLRRARGGARLARGFEIEAPAIALVLDLLDEIERLKARVR